MVLKKEITFQIKELLQKNPQGLNITDIVKEVNINRNTAGRYLENLLVSGHVDMRRLGMAKIYMLSQRVPVSAVLSISSELVIQLDSSLRIVFVNEPFLKLVGTDSKNLLGKNIEYTPVQLIFDEFFTGFIENIRKGITGREWSGEITLTSKDVILSCQIAPTVFDDGRKGVSVILEDITKRKKAEEAVQESEMRYRSLVETTGTGYVIIDQDGRVITANQEYVRLTGRCSLAEIEGRLLIDWTAPYDRERNARELDQCLRKGQVKDLEIDYQRPDGTIQPIEINASVIRSGSVGIILTLCRDITQRRHDEKTLQESEDRYRKLIEISPNAVFLHQEGKIIYVNPAAFMLLGATRSDEIIGKGVYDFICPDFRDVVKTNIEKDLQGQMSPRTELHMLRVDGTEIIVEGRGIATEIGGKPAVQVAIRDITESKRAEEALRESEGTFRSLVQESSDGIVIADESGKVIVWNEALARISGIPKDEAIGNLYIDLMVSTIVPEHRELARIAKMREIVHEQLHNGVSPYFFRPLNAEIIRKDGSRCYIQQTAFPIQTAKGYRIGSIIRNVTELKRAEEALNKSESLYRTLAEASSDLIFIVGRDDRVEYVNNYASEMVGKPVSQITGNPRSTLFPVEVAKDQKKTLDKVFETGITVRSENPLTFNERIYWFDHILIPLKDADNHVQSVLGISRNITERKSAEKALVESEGKYRTLVDRANDVICIIQDGFIKMCNPRLPEFWRGSIEEIIGKHISEFIHPDALSDVITRYNRRMAGENSPSIYETVFMRKDGSKSFVELNAGIITYEGKIADLVIVRDINERKKAEDTLRESEETARALLNAPTDSVLLIDDKGVILALNSITASRLGKHSDDLIGTLSYDHLPKEVAQRRRLLMAPLLEKKESVRFVDEREGRWYDTVAYPIINETGDVKKIAIIARDITEQKNIEKQLRESEQMYKHLLEQSFDAIAIHKEGKIAFLNEKAIKILGAASAEELIGRSIFDLIHPDSLKDLENRLQDLSYAKGKPVPVITEKFFRLDGTIVTVEVMAISFDDNNKPAVRVAFREIAPTAER